VNPLSLSLEGRDPFIWGIGVKRTIHMAVIECTKGSIWLGLRSKDLLNLQLKTELYAGLQGSVATHLVFGGIFKYSFVTNFLLSLTMKEI